MNGISRERRMFKDAHADKYSRVRHFPALHAPVCGSRPLHHVLVVQEDPKEYAAPKSYPKNTRMQQTKSRRHIQSTVGLAYYEENRY